MMPLYRLLRNNKETGPYSLQDLTELSLKAYDLVWIEGKSFSWKYPSEIEELKGFAPPAAEDFYVQYHSPAEASRLSSVNATATVSYPKIPKEEDLQAPRAKVAGAMVVQRKPRRYVSVILPAGSNSQAQAVELMPLTGAPSGEPALVAEDITVLTGADPDIPKTEHIHAHAKNRALIATAFLALLAAGIYFGTTKLRRPAAEPIAASAMQVSMASFKGDTDKRLQEGEGTGTEMTGLAPNLALDFAAIQRFVQVKPGEYQVGLFGGISRLELLVTNRSTKPLQDVAIVVEYLNADKTISHKETLLIRSIDPFGTVKATVHDSPYGIAFRTKVVGVNGLKGL